MTSPDLQATLTSGTLDDVLGSTNDYCLGRDGQTNHAGDAVVIATFDQGPAALVIKRGIPPFTGLWALPGGMHDVGEAMSRTVERELMEEVGVDAAQAQHAIDLGTIQSTAWDPRFVAADVTGRAFIVDPAVDFTPGDDADDAAWVPVEDLASGRQPLAFEHAQWLARTFAADTPVRNPEWAEAFTLLAAAARQRNRGLIRQANVIRHDKGGKKIPLDPGQETQDTALLQPYLTKGTEVVPTVRRGTRGPAQGVSFIR